MADDDITSEHVLLNVMKQQNDLTEILLKQENLDLLLTREIPVFNGDLSWEASQDRFRLPV